MHVHILGICGTFMGGVAALARAAGHRVTGSDRGVYPPMSTQLQSLGIDIVEGYEATQLNPAPDCVVVGNVMSRGMPVVEAMLDAGLPYFSGPDWLARHVLADRWVLAVAGTHGKTTVSSILAWILEDAGLDPGFLIGGIPANFAVSARLGGGRFFVVEADEYDTAFFDKRSKFVHYRPRTLILNNLEFDHADIFPDLESIKTQFHHLMRTVPGSGLVILNAADGNLGDVVNRGCWTPTETFSEPGEQGDWQINSSGTGSGFGIMRAGACCGTVEWSLPGRHNQLNALASLLAARHAGIPLKSGIEALSRFKGVRRRMEVRGRQAGVTVFDDFAHHPTEIAATIAGAATVSQQGRLIAVFEPRSNTMRMGVHREALRTAFSGADRIYLFRPPGLDWDLEAMAGNMDPAAVVSDEIDDLVTRLVSELRSGDHVIIMSNGGFGGIHDRLLDALRERGES
ncbi:MAG: UDP-N-acetylmuramate:L-alanyl-gamma-D-glutamyl-meso-diaminopimelate ligase [Gammaproteobacteria bacterium]|nr:MAG: UDP-N-acetylmuramate:L-alanyl-gamma-D-glutamyl-meso-diaminopimelate ligase [Gammaproteobacteria bacterium]